MWAAPTTSTTQRGYDYTHVKARRAALAAYHPSDPCCQCGHPLGDNTRAIHLDHNDDRDGYRGLAHAACNQYAAAVKGSRLAHEQRNNQRLPGRRSRVW